MRNAARVEVTISVCLWLSGMAMLFGIPPANSADWDKGWQAYVSKDYATALREFKPLAEQGDAVAQLNLGLMYRDGQGVIQDYNEAVKWFRKAAQQKLSPALVNLGTMYVKGWGGEQNFKAAAKLYLEAAGHGFAAAQYELGILYVNGYGVAKNYSEAIEWFRKAAEQGLPRAQLYLGVMYAMGLGTIKDYTRAHMWWNLAASRGNKRAKSNRDAYEEKMTPSQIADAQNLARNFVPNITPTRRSDGIQVPKNDQRPRLGALPRPGSGSGFIVSKLGHVITNAHVVRGCRSITLGTEPDQQQIAKIISEDKRNDLALLKLSTPERIESSKSLLRNLGVQVLSRLDKGQLRSRDVRLGEKVVVAGFPFGDVISSSIKITSGIVSATRGLADNTGQFQLDAAVQPGNSGGPIYDKSGNIVGVVVARLNKLKMAKAIGSFPELSNFGVKISVVRTFIESSGLPVGNSGKGGSISTELIAGLAKKQTVMITCTQ